jgi:hypothetical protein
MAYTSTELQELRSAMASGVLKTRFSDGREITFRTLAEMQEQERVMAAEVESGSQLRPVRRIYQSFRRA